LFSLLLREDSSRVVTVDAVTINNELPLRRSTGYLDSTRALQNVESVLAVRQTLTALYFAYPSRADACTTRITRRLLVSPAQPVYFYVRVEADPTSTMLQENSSFYAKESIVGESTNAPLAVSVPLRFGYLTPLYPALDTH